MKLFTFAAVLLVASSSAQQPQSSHRADTKARGRTMHATGSFEVKVAPTEASQIGKEAGVGRMTIDKVWSGDIQGSSKGEMLTGVTSETGSMAYTAVERVTAKIGGKSGSFYFVHRGIMLANDPKSGSLEITVVPSSGTGELAGLSGSLTIDMSGGGHRYDFSYELP